MMWKSQPVRIPYPQHALKADAHRFFFFSNLDANVDMSKVKINCTIHFTCKR